MNKHFYVIKYSPEMMTWHRIHVSGFTLDDAKKFKQNYSQDQKNLDIIHEMWLDCLEEWPEPDFFIK